MERKITIETEGIYKEDYQMRILRTNPIEGLLAMSAQGVGEKTRYEYEVSGKVSIQAMYERGSVSSQDARQLLYQLPRLLQDVKRHLLDIHCLLMNPEYIFYEEENFFFCYYPLGGRNVWEDIGKLADFFVKHADYKDTACVQMVFAFHQGVGVDNYSLDKVVEACMETGEERVIYDTSEHDWIAKQETVGTIMEETQNLWTPVKKFLNRHKRPKWGDFDDLYIEEEEL